MAAVGRRWATEASLENSKIKIEIQKRLQIQIQKQYRGGEEEGGQNWLDKQIYIFVTLLEVDNRTLWWVCNKD